MQWLAMFTFLHNTMFLVSARCKIKIKGWKYEKNTIEKKRKALRSKKRRHVLDSTSPTDIETLVVYSSPCCNVEEYIKKMKIQKSCYKR